jgi:hypothetical protein
VVSQDTNHGGFLLNLNTSYQVYMSSYVIAFRDLRFIISICRLGSSRLEPKVVRVDTNQYQHMRKKISILVSVLLSTFVISAQDKTIQAIRTDQVIKLDGVINEAAWKASPVITGLIEMRPTFGRVEDSRNKTEIYILYDDNAVYFGGKLYESNKDSIATQLSGRDQIGVTDFIGIVFDTYQDKINGMGFYVTPLNEQFDLKYSIGMNNGEDLSWNAVYSTAAKIDNDGWSFEMKIPYSAIRFSKEAVQNWNIHIIRRRAKSGQQFSWSPIDPTKFGFMNQAGTLIGLKDIKPPLRLSFSPYFSTYLSKNPNVSKDWKVNVNGGMDVKYGISDGFTMDMTLIPDFGQVQSDNQILNLSPFEVKFNENRQFFTEGIELFSKGNLFYSRRIGGQPIHYYDINLAPGETITKNPVETKLINATKISGRTKKKLGIGFFNAITKPQYAEVEDQFGGKHEVQTNPLTNYNIMVLDQGLKNNSRVTLINTNVWRSGKDYDANVTALDWDLYDNNVDWNVWGQVNHSRLIDYEAPGKTVKGYMYNLFLGKFKGRFNFDVHRFFVDDKYNQSDMGFFTNNNYVTHGFYAGYKWVKPKSFYNNIYINLNGNYSQLYKPRQYQDFRLNGNVNGQMKNLWSVGVNFDVRPEANDFYEARIPDQVFKRPGSWMKGAWVNSNRAKKYTISAELYHRHSNRYNTNNYETYFGQDYRFSSKLTVGLSHFLGFYNNDYGFAYVAPTQDSVITGLRRRRTAENVLNVRYNFNNMMGLTFRLRHYWSKVDYKEFFNLKEDGYAESISTVSTNPNVNLNLFNIDMNYSWQFAPGSFINVNWKTASELFDQIVHERYYKNLRKTIETPQATSFSVKVIYFLDYLDIKGKGKKKKAVG